MIRRTISAGLAICMVFSLCSCKKTPNVIQTEEQQDNVSFISVMLGDKNIEEWNENHIIANVAWNSLRLSEDDAAKFPELKKTFDKQNVNALKDAKAQMYELMNAAKDLSGDALNPLFLNGTSKTYIQRADSEIVSYLEGVSIYAGGIHPDYFYKAVNLNPTTGGNLNFTDIISNQEALPRILSDAIIKKYYYINFGENQPETILKEYSSEDYTWTLDYQGITFWFSPYDIASYAVGPLSVKLYFDENPNIIKEKYKKAPSESFGMMLPFSQKIDFDLNPDDGQKDYIEIDTTPDGYGGNYNMLSVTVNGKTFTDEINYAYDFDVYLANVGDKNFIYSDSWSDNDYHMFCIWDIDGQKLDKVHELYGTKLSDTFVEEGEENEAVYQTVLNNPASFKLDERLDVLGTREIRANYRISETDGIPEMTDKDYSFDGGQDVFLKIPLVAEILPEGDTEELGEGMRLTPCRTDGKTYVELMTENGWTVRFKIDLSGWPKTVNGIPEEECFEGLLYAG